MFRSVSRIGFLRRSLCSSFTSVSTPVLQESSGLVPNQSASGVLSFLGIGGQPGVPMTEPFPATVTPLPIPPPQQPPKTEFTSLPNGFRVASEDIWVTRSDLASFQSSFRVPPHPSDWPSRVVVRTKQRRIQVNSKPNKSQTPSRVRAFVGVLSIQGECQSNAFSHTPGVVRFRCEYFSTRFAWTDLLLNRLHQKRCT